MAQSQIGYQVLSKSIKKGGNREYLVNDSKINEATYRLTDENATLSVVILGKSKSHAQSLRMEFAQRAETIASQFDCRYQDANGITSYPFATKAGVTFHGAMALQAAETLSSIY